MYIICSMYIYSQGCEENKKYLSKTIMKKNKPYTFHQTFVYLLLSMSLTLFGNDKINDDFDTNKPLGRVGYSLHLYYELSELDKNDNPQKDKEKEDILKNNYNTLNYCEDNENKAYYNNLNQENTKFENTDEWNKIKKNDENIAKNEYGSNISNRDYNKNNKFNVNRNNNNKNNNKLIQGGIQVGIIWGRINRQ